MVDTVQKIIVCKPKRNISSMNQCYGELFGVSVEVKLIANQYWTAKKSQGYWRLKCKGLNLRLTDAAFDRLFTIIV